MINTICKIMSISRSAYFKFKKEERPVISLLEKYFTKEELEEFLKNGQIEKCEQLKHPLQTSQTTAISLLEDYAKFGLHAKIDELFSIFGLPDFTKFLPKKLFIKILNDMQTEGIYTYENAKDTLLQRLKGYETSFVKLEHPNHPKILCTFIDTKLSKIEVYLLIKNMTTFLQ